MTVSSGPTPIWINKSSTNSLNGLISSNLIYCLDPARTLSYAGTGNTIYDLTGTNVTATARNGITYDSEGLGNFVFDGTNDYMSFVKGSDPTLHGDPGFNSANTYSPISLQTVCSVYFWIKPVTGNGGLFSHYSGGPVNLGLQLKNSKMSVYQYHTTWTEYISTGSSVPLNTWSQLAWIRSSTNSMSLYLNNTLNTTLTPSGSELFSGGNMGSFGSFWGFNFFNGKIGIILVYNNVAHTQSQVSQQFQTLRKRYNI